jgi:flagellar hook-associated protein FlgK
MQAARPLAGTGRGMYGTGSQVTAIIQIRDRFLDRKFWNQSAISGQFTAVNTHLNFVETVFNQLPNVGVKRTFNGFFSTVQDLTTRAHEATFRTNVITNGLSLTEQVRQNAFALQRQQLDLNREFSDVIVTINSLGAQIADINRQIHIFERNGDNANDLRDQRALLIDQLSELVNIQVEERDFSRPGVSYDRRLSVMINGQDFVDHTRINLLQLVARDNPHDERSGSRRNEMDVAGLYDVFFEMTGSRFDIYSSTLSGKLRGIVDVRDGNGGQVTALPILTGQLMIQTQLAALSRTSDFLGGLTGPTGLFTTLSSSLPGWVADRDAALTALGGSANTAQARAYLNNLLNVRTERNNINTSLQFLRNGLVTSVGLTSLRSAINAAVSPADPTLTAILDDIGALLNTVTATTFDPLTFDMANFRSDLTDLLDDLATHPALASHSAILTTIGNINVTTITTPLANALNRLDEIETDYGTVTALDADIAAAQTQMNLLNAAVRGITDITEFANRLESQLDWAIRNAMDMRNLIQDRITQIENGISAGDIDAYRDFLIALNAEIDDMQDIADALSLALPTTLNVYSSQADLDDLIDALSNAVNGMGSGFPASIAAIEAAAATILPAGTSRTEGVTTNFKGIPFYMNQLNHLIRTFARAMNEGRNTDGNQIAGAIGHIYGFDANGENRNAMFFTYEDPTTGRAGVVVDENDPFNSLRMWILADAAGNPLRDARGNLITVQDPNPPANVARDTMGRPMFTLDYSQFNALNFIVNPELLNDPSLLAASGNQNIGQANNDVVHGFLAVGNDNSLFREGRLIDFIIATSNHLAVDNNQAQMFRESYHEITMQTHNHRLSVSSVDTEEEMLNLVRFQNMFIAASKLINVIDTVYDTLINRLGNF